MDSTTLRLVAIAALVLVNGFFVAAEFALVSARSQRLREEGSSRARLALRQVRHLDEYLAACQLGITIASLALGALGEPTIAALLEPLREDPDGVMTTLKTALERPEDRLDPNRGKVVVDARDRALTFTRLPIVEGVSPGQDYYNRADVEAAHARIPLEVWSDIGVYGYRREFLLRYAALAPGRFEQAERLEQLRALEHGFEIVVPTVHHRALEVDVPDDVPRVEAALAAAGE